MSPLAKQLATILKVQHEILALLRQKLGLNGMGEFLDNADLKVLLKIGDKSIYRLRQSGQLKGFKVAGRWYYDRKHVAALLDDGKLDL